ncbi:glycosyltransferase [Lyngbya confervoides]|uniref:Beta-monoglucosyldiacylglycerol synthase n=1 Tax=Lyngbya confervoides BDU141951 TaxID=1574623 RepID=A0ABD4T364_9CYAN|nr:glycosyltransferase family 2 protein [Lyngbya confervoides]MCM1982677.1 glycosyltransferase family 2 protein [Lyngbya confervoides BDU141951]
MSKLVANRNHASGGLEDNFELDFDYPATGSRRRRAATVVAAVWLSTWILHGVSWGIWAGFGLAAVFGLHTVRLLFAPAPEAPPPLSEDTPAMGYPLISLVVAAKNEESVITSLVRNLDALDYPSDRLELWVVDDNSEDRTLSMLKALSSAYPQLHVHSRPLGAQGGKSGALNDVLPLTRGELLGVFDADAQIPATLLRAVVPLFNRSAVGAVQVRKSITNADCNVLTQGQQAEMVLDAFMQQQRIATGGLGELRGNGQFVRRQALMACGGWNELTITDDLDLTFRLHLNRWDIDLLQVPAVQEEGVTRPLALWHQRNRWAEGGYQRYLDYWPMLARNELGRAKTFDMLMFYLTQYLLPTAAIPDMILSWSRNQLPLLMPVTSLAIALSFFGTWVGLQQTYERERREARRFSLIAQSLQATVYLCHWFVVVSSVTLRMAVRPKRLKWVKTQRVGA